MSCAARQSEACYAVVKTLGELQQSAAVTFLRIRRRSGAAYYPYWAITPAVGHPAAPPRE